MHGPRRERGVGASQGKGNVGRWKRVRTFRKIKERILKILEEGADI